MTLQTAGEIDVRTEMFQSVRNLIRGASHRPDVVEPNSFFSVWIWKQIASVFRRHPSAGESCLLAKTVIFEAVREEALPLRA